MLVVVAPFLVFASSNSIRAQASAQNASAPALELVTLGSGGPGALGRAGSSHLILIHGEPRILVDAGPGSFVRLGESKLSLDKIDIVLLTHLNADHVSELPGIIKARAVALHRPIRFRVFGPEGSGKQGQITYFPSTRRFMDLMFGPEGAFAYLPDFAGRITFETVDLPARTGAQDKPQVIFDEQGLTIRAISGHHGDAPAVAYRIDYGGKQIVFSGDMDEKGLDNLRKIASGASLLVFNSAVLDPPKAPPILYSFHSPPGAIGRVAAEAKVSAVLLAHLSPATEQNRQEVEDSIHASYSGPVRFAEDKLVTRP
ncbi:MBL fold metallo-hydrolase [Rhodoblastus sp.]|uniref:MBL fold metallo-hydrolase n=1 Tax=Rhodoblastus sp. TaxID=1962975 RepID=UPI0035B258A1